MTSYIKSFIPKSFLSSQLYSMIIKGLRYLPCWRNFHDCSSMRWDGRKDNLQHQACCSLLKHLEITCQFLVDSLHLHVDLMPLKIVNYFRFSKDLFLKKKKKNNIIIIWVISFCLLTPTSFTISTIAHLPVGLSSIILHYSQWVVPQKWSWSTSTPDHKPTKFFNKL